MLTAGLRDWVLAACGSEALAATSLGGGCINEVQRLVLADGRNCILKTQPGCPADFFAAEAAGLRALAGAGAPVPGVLAVSPQGLLLEDLGCGSPRRDCWEQLAVQLVSAHATTAGEFGWDRDGYIGATPQRNRRDADGYRFFAEQRLLFQAHLAQRQRRLGTRDCDRIATLCARLPELVPAHAPALVHGDLWSGNIHVQRDGRAALLDPACHFGWAESDLAMSLLFGELPEAFYAAYQHEAGIGSDWRQRAPVYNLYHLLNHLNLFGAGYLAPVRRVLDRYC